VRFSYIHQYCRGLSLVNVTWFDTEVFILQDELIARLMNKR
jgi:hypothetical protein